MTGLRVRVHGVLAKRRKDECNIEDPTANIQCWSEEGSHIASGFRRFASGSGTGFPWR